MLRLDMALSEELSDCETQIRMLEDWLGSISTCSKDGARENLIRLESLIASVPDISRAPSPVKKVYSTIEQMVAAGQNYNKDLELLVDKARRLYADRAFDKK